MCEWGGGGEYAQRYDLQMLCGFNMLSEFPDCSRYDEDTSPEHRPIQSTPIHRLLRSMSREARPPPPPSPSPRPSPSPPVEEKSSVEDVPPKRKRGRPRKNPLPISTPSPLGLPSRPPSPSKEKRESNGKRPSNGMENESEISKKGKVRKTTLICNLMIQITRLIWMVMIYSHLRDCLVDLKGKE